MAARHERPTAPSPAPSPTGPRYVELVRVSSQGQARADTPEDQRAALDRLRETRPGTLVAERIDSTVSGAADPDDRADLQQLARLAADPGFDEVRVRHVDRLTRHDDPAERFKVYSIVAAASAVIVDCAGHVIDPRSEMGEVDYYLQTLMAARERKRILERTQTAKQRKAGEGRLAQGSPPLGRTFDKATGAWGIDEEKASTYRRMFDLCLGGKSLAGIAAALNAEGLLSPRGLRWTGQNVERLLRDPAAYGRYETHGHAFEIPAIVTREVFDAAGARLASNNKLSGPKPTVTALLRKLAVCASCGAPIYLQVGGGASRLRYYYCRGRHPACSGYWRVDDLDARITALLRDWMSDPAMVRELIADPGAEKEERERAEAEIAAAEKARASLDEEEERVAGMLARRQIQDKTGSSLLAKVATRRTEAEARLAQAKAAEGALARRAEIAESIEAAVRRTTEEIRAMGAEECREALEGFFPPRSIRLHLPPGRARGGKVKIVARQTPVPGSRWTKIDLGITAWRVTNASRASGTR